MKLKSMKLGTEKQKKQVNETEIWLFERLINNDKHLIRLTKKNPEDVNYKYQEKNR